VSTQPTVSDVVVATTSAVVEASLPGPALAPTLPVKKPAPARKKMTAAAATVVKKAVPVAKAKSTAAKKATIKSTQAKSTKKK
jgi:hypothetical protein